MSKEATLKTPCREDRTLSRADTAPSPKLEASSPGKRPLTVLSGGRVQQLRTKKINDTTLLGLFGLVEPQHRRRPRRR